jgi:HAD superfamily hydrolase (TIGR01509 family)
MPNRLALIFDVDGTLADTERLHREAFNEAFADEGLDWNWSESLYTRLLAVSGGKERIAAYFQEIEGTAMASEVVERVHAAKTRRYVAKIESDRISLRPGVLDLFEEARARDFPLAIATTTTPANVDALLRGALGLSWRETFAAIGDASTAPKKKPDPQVYLGVLKALDRPASTCLAFEDSKNGLDAAREAGIPTVVTPTAFTAHEDFSGAIAVYPDLRACSLDELVHLQSAAV